MLPFRWPNCGEAGPCCEFGEPDVQAPCLWEEGADVVPAWFLKMLSSKFFTPCERHSSLKKNEARCLWGVCNFLHFAVLVLRRGGSRCHGSALVAN